jgi:hypothetical protein
VSVTLPYDDLPPGSDVRRTLAENTLHITIPAGEPPAHALKQSAYDALASGALLSAPMLAFACVIFYLGIRANRVSGVALTWAWAFFAVFCAAIVMLTAWIRFGVLSDVLRLGRRQSTVLAATEARLIIETSGPFGAASLDLPRQSIRRISIARAAILDHRSHRRRVQHMLITLNNGRAIALLPARDPREIQCIARMIAQTMRLTPPEAGTVRAAAAAF